MLHARTDAALGAVAQPFGLVFAAALAHAPIREVARLWGCRLDDVRTAQVAAVAVDALFRTVQQLGQRMLVVHVGSGEHRAVYQPAPAVCAHVHLHAEVPLVALARLLHLGVALPIGVLGRARRGDDGGIHDGARAQLEPTLLQDAADHGEDGLPQVVALQQVAELADGGGIRHRLAAQVDANESTQCRRVVQRLLARGVGQIEPVLQQVDAQHALQAHGRAAVAGLRVMRLDQRHQPIPRHDRLHLGQKCVAARGLAKALESRRRIGRRCQGHLLHPHPRILHRHLQRMSLRCGGLDQRFPKVAGLTGCTLPGDRLSVCAPKSRHRQAAAATDRPADPLSSAHSRSSA